jgi:hypothetical protein
MKPICVMASEVAALVGANRYKTREEVQVQLWERSNPSQYRRSKALLSASVGRALQTDKERAEAAVTALEQERVTKAVARVRTSSLKRALNADPLLQAMPCKQARIEAAERAVASALSVAVERAVEALPRTARPEAQRILRHAEPKEATKALSKLTPTAATIVRSVADARRTAAQRAVEAALPSVTEGVTAAVDGDATTKAALSTLSAQPSVQRLLRQRVHTARGTQREAQGLDRYERSSGAAVTERNDQGYSRRYALPNGRTLVLYGKIDGVQGEEVIEHKDRQNRLFGRLIQRERIQLLVYLALTGRTKGALVETYGSEQRRYDLTFDQDEWDALLANIKGVVATLYDVLLGEDEAPRAALLRSVMR